MKKIDAGQAISVLANIGVLAGILLLVYELSLNRQVTEAQTRTAVAQGVTDHLYVIMNDEETASLVLRGDSGEQLTAVEEYRYEGLVIALLRHYENVHYQYRNGLYDEGEFEAQRGSWRNAIFSRKGVAELWCRTRGRFSPEFVEEINGLLTAYQCPEA